MNPSTTQYTSHHFTYSDYHTTSYSSYDANGTSHPSVRDDSDDLARLWSYGCYAIADEPSMCDRPSSVHQPELDSTQQRTDFSFSSMVDPMPLVSTHPSDISFPPGPYDVGSHHDLRYANTRLHFQYDAMSYDPPSIECSSRSSIAPRQPEAFSVLCVAPTLVSSLVPDAPGGLPLHHSPTLEASETYHISSPYHGAMPSAGSSASPHHSSHSLSPSPSPSPIQSRPRLVVSKRRNAHVPTPPLTRGSSSPRSTTATATTITTNRWKCPYCTHVQWNRRSPDLKRHIATHTRSDDDASWVCCGVPVVDALEYGVPGTSVHEEHLYVHNGMFMVGGCRKTFSRKDAYVRHLRREKGKCFGDADATYQAGNRVDIGEF